MEQHNVLGGLKEHGYTDIDHRSKVRYLNKGIKTTCLESVKTRIMSDEILIQDFDGCVTLYKYFVKLSRADDRQPLGIVELCSNNVCYVCP